MSLRPEARPRRTWSRSLMDNLQEFKDLKVAYQRCFETEHGKKVLKDLERRCFKDESTFNCDPYISAFQEGMRSVVVNINHMRDMDYGLQEGKEAQIERT